tara:strand:- start:212 stop:388 length:177 start_codon:yes stop_codon:yes gene_type:complete
MCGWRVCAHFDLVIADHLGQLVLPNSGDQSLSFGPVCAECAADVTETMRGWTTAAIGL